MVLIYINPLNKNYKGEQTYEFLFAKTQEITYGNDWDVAPASSVEVTPPPIEDVTLVGILKTDEIELELALMSDHFSMYDSVENIVALGWEKESPENEERLVFHFGEEFESVKKKIYSRDKIMETIKPQ